MYFIVFHAFVGNELAYIIFIIIIFMFFEIDIKSRSKNHSVSTVVTSDTDPSCEMCILIYNIEIVNKSWWACEVRDSGGRLNLRV